MSLILSGSNGLSDVDGTVTTPAIRGTDTNTGIFFPAADTIAFSEGGVEAMRIDSSGNVGINTTTPAAKLSVDGSAIFNDSGADVDFRVEGDTDANLLFVDASTDRVGVGTNAPLTKLDVLGPAGVTSFTGTTRLGVTVKGSTGTTDYSGIDLTGNGVSGAPFARIAVLSTGGGSFLQFGTSNNYTLGITNTAMSIDPSGNLLVGTTTGSAKSNITSTSATNVMNWRNFSDAGYGVACLNAAGTAAGSITWTASTTFFSTSSDYRLKENVAPMQNALATVAALKPCTYTWKSTGEAGQGFIAHELQAVVPECVVGEKDAVDSEGNPQYQGVDTSFLVATLVAAIQELKAEFDAYKAAHP